jgi:hypothetical protein
MAETTFARLTNGRDYRAARRKRLKWLNRSVAKLYRATTSQEPDVISNCSVCLPTYRCQFYQIALMFPECC